METPTGSGRPGRMATPRLSERKRQLFGSPRSRLRQINDDEDDADVDSLGVLPLKTHVAANRQGRSLFAAGAAKSSSSANSSPETNKENKKTRGGVMTATAEQLPQLFTATMRLNSNSSSNSRNSSPRQPRVQRKRADSSMSSPTSSSEGTPSSRARTSIRRSPRTFSAQKDPDSSSSPESFQTRLSKVADMLMKGQDPRSMLEKSKKKHNHSLKTTAQVHTTKPKKTSPAEESQSEDEKPSSSKNSMKNTEVRETRSSQIISPKTRNSRRNFTSAGKTLKAAAHVHENLRSDDEENRDIKKEAFKIENSSSRSKSPVEVFKSNDNKTAKSRKGAAAKRPESPRSMKIDVEVPESDEEPYDHKPQKRQHPETSTQAAPSADSDSGSPQSKMRRVTLSSSIPTMAFYSHSGEAVTKSRKRPSISKNSLKQPTKISPTSRPLLGINKGVRHKIRKRHGFANRLPATDMDNILNSLSNERLKNLITTKREERAKVEEVHQILRNAKDPIKMAKPLSVIEADDANNNNNLPATAWQETSADFSDLSDVEDIDPIIEVEPIIPIIRHEPVQKSPTAEPADLSKRKFFKSGRRSSTCMEVRITDNIRASVSQGKIELVQTIRRKPRQVRVKSATIFSAEQATVDAILKNLDDTVVDEIVEANPVVQATPMDAEETSMETEPLPDIIEYAPEANDVEIDPFAEFRQRLPYQTDDPNVVEQQQILLEFLISNNICTERNFEIFIANPDNYKDEANQIVDNLYMVVNSEEAAQLAQMETVENTAVAIAPQQDAPAVEEVQPKLFPIFTQRLQPVVQKSLRRRPDTSMRLLTAAGGSNQYQIDAGQKAFGARQCQQCGLVYTVHEPEEELLHREYHNSIHVLRFKGWIDEDIVSVYPEWASDGRIIRINERAPAARLDRLRDLIGVVDKELGYSSYIVPKIFVAFIAVRKQQIVGFCLVQPLSQAHRFIQVDGTDYFSEESYPASCGVSRIWVSPLQRRSGIASKLLRVVQCHTVLGQEIARECIAFSTPTDDGRALARQFTGLDNFLTYDQ
ncbi:N-acetyltransferase eco [Drosophila mauritiana]|uniref:N-acetyltransferase eco n=1 Tax=Drosophila mauritiana TaxID=7226 RepID=A0A6P8K7J3_DROMA|nr:N-acetyltransferase eco [Drosophila mauritiana]